VKEPSNNDKKTPRNCWRTRNVAPSCDVCGARPEVVHVPMHGKGFRCPEHCENCGPAASNREGELPRK
jgi:hypothetical protein